MLGCQFTRTNTEGVGGEGAVDDTSTEGFREDAVGGNIDVRREGVCPGDTIPAKACLGVVNRSL